MNNVRTVSDTKRSFYNLHTRPINSIYRRVVEELMVEMHLLSVNVDFRYDPIYALGVVSSFERFMQGYIPEQDKPSIFNAICQALEDDPQRYQHDGQRLQEFVSRLSPSELVAWLSQSSLPAEAGDLQEHLLGIAHNSHFKYSRLFAIGLFTLLELASPDLVKDDKQRVEAQQKICEALHLPADKLQKDLELYRSNLEKMAQARIVLADVLSADRKKREQRAQAKSTVEAPSNGSSEFKL
ncbi:photosystem II biogenesis protein Psp29 [Microcoleus sp. FACHB-672]|uniref:photosystem II biogenesis protein Psp29 n=1 Tax=Microcoleus sp. FACHB-672 TaxID=2692825 RepID=UPI0016864DA2|nr:photosystem II biogenesis protein Psp29 [Microcoleus sp. FACHB-672]MBD2042052.1 photosystem II biogenesis protein Psp29 [Microcoleus sp. FACHB-672]